MQQARPGTSPIVVSPALHVILAVAGVLVIAGGVFLIGSGLGAWGGPTAGTPEEPAWRSLVSGVVGCILGVSLAVTQSRRAARGLRNRTQASAPSHPAALDPNDRG
ncbi:hypothetical protein DVJ78_10385 [Humibacter sp. BT305]|nr:hypothetical protein DVJ78_10385 [Humibacter sp. BT305]